MASVVAVMYSLEILRVVRQNGLQIAGVRVGRHLQTIRGSECRHPLQQANIQKSS